MKKLFFIAFVLLGFVSSCEEKEKQISPDELLIPQNFSANGLRFFDVYDGEYDCRGSAGNCLPDIIVKPGVLTRLKSTEIDQKNLIELCGSNLDRELLYFAKEGTLASFSVVHRENISYVLIKNTTGETLQVQPYRTE